MDRRQFLFFSLAAGTAASGPIYAQAPPVRIVIGFSVGGSADTVARLFADTLRRVSVSAVVVESKSGAGGTIAAEFVKNAPADGATVLLGPTTPLTLQPFTNAGLRYAPATDFVPVSSLAMYGGVLAIGPKVPPAVTRFQDFATWAKANPKEADYGSSGAGGGAHFLGFQIFRELGVTATHVPYKGFQPAIADMLGGQIAAVVSGITEAMPHARSGRARLLAVTLPKRSKHLPDVPTLAEVCCDGLVGSTDLMGVYVAARTPPVQVAQLADVARTLTSDPSFAAACEPISLEPWFLGPESFSERLERERSLWQDVVKASGFQPTS